MKGPHRSKGKIAKSKKKQKGQSKVVQGKKENLDLQINLKELPHLVPRKEILDLRSRQSKTQESTTMSRKKTLNMLNSLEKLLHLITRISSEILDMTN